MRRLIVALLLPVLAACSFAPTRPYPGDAPYFALPPASLGRELSLQQQLRFVSPNGGDRTLDAYLEADAAAVRLAAMVSGQTAMRIIWDGNDLTSQRADWLPKTVDAAAVLSDLQLVYWPLPALQAALAPGWSLEDDASSRRLVQGGEVVIEVHYSERSGEARHISIDHPRLGMRLEIESASSTAS
ncbi:DUF3261 domain-containing protein [Uliginosibacterium sp. sgz301328]|uniref:DUF3261 domain-containing protein n=1 Tax=Uliginosibacterium sp. sgz301328 TaxID=3243764 RepID=UPI00359E346A